MMVTMLDYVISSVGWSFAGLVVGYWAGRSQAEALKTKRKQRGRGDDNA